LLARLVAHESSHFRDPPAPAAQPHRPAPAAHRTRAVLSVCGRCQSPDPAKIPVQRRRAPGRSSGPTQPPRALRASRPGPGSVAPLPSPRGVMRTHPPSAVLALLLCAAGLGPAGLAADPPPASRAWALRQTPVTDVVRRVKDAVVNI